MGSMEMEVGMTREERSMSNATKKLKRPHHYALQFQSLIKIGQINCNNTSEDGSLYEEA